MERPETPFSRPREALDRLSQWSGELRQGFGADSVVQRPTVRVREVETMLLLSLLKSMKELLLLSGNEYLYENLLELQRAALRRRDGIRDIQVM